MFTEKELKALAKLLDPVLSDAEAEGSEEPFIRMLRKRGAKIEEFQGNGNVNSNGAVAPKQSHPDYGTCRYPYNPYKGEMFIDVPPDYLEEFAAFVEGSANAQTPDNLKLVERIRIFLAQ